MKKIFAYILIAAFFIALTGRIADAAALYDAAGKRMLERLEQE